MLKEISCSTLALCLAWAGLCPALAEDGGSYRSPEETHRSGQMILAGIGESVREWLKSPADKSTDAEKLEFMKTQGISVESGVYVERDGAIRLTDRGNALFSGLKPAYNAYVALLKQGYQPVSAEQGAKLQMMERVVNHKIVQMRESCKDIARLNSEETFPIACAFISESAYVRKAGKAYLVSPEGQQVLEIMSGQ